LRQAEFQSGSLDLLASVGRYKNVLHLDYCLHGNFLTTQQDESLQMGPKKPGNAEGTQQEDIIKDWQ
jgi:hypothetical protein